MQVEIISPEKTLYTGEAKLVQLPAYEGSLEILKNHAPMISILKEGKIKIEEMDKTLLFFDIKGGVAEVLKNKVLILAS